MPKKRVSKTSSAESPKPQGDIADVVQAAVEQVEEYSRKIALLKEEHPRVFQELMALQEAYNTALEHAEKLVRAHLVFVGPFRARSLRRSYNFQELCELVGEEEFKRMGGRVVTVTSTQFEMTNEAFEEEEFVKLPADVQGKVAKTIVQLQAPKAMKV